MEDWMERWPPPLIAMASNLLPPHSNGLNLLAMASNLRKWMEDWMDANIKSFQVGSCSQKSQDG